MNNSSNPTLDKPMGNHSMYVSPLSGPGFVVCGGYVDISECFPHPHSHSDYHLLQTNSEMTVALVVLLYAKEKNGQTHEQPQHGGREQKCPWSRDGYERGINKKVIQNTLAFSRVVCNK